MSLRLTSTLYSERDYALARPGSILDEVLQGALNADEHCECGAERCARTTIVIDQTPLAATAFEHVGGSWSGEVHDVTIPAYPRTVYMCHHGHEDREEALGCPRVLAMVAGPRPGA